MLIAGAACQGGPPPLAPATYADTADLAASTDQSLPNRADAGATVFQMGSTAGVETSDPARLVLLSGDSVGVWFPGTGGNRVSASAKTIPATPNGGTYEVYLEETVAGVYAASPNGFVLGGGTAFVNHPWSVRVLGPTTIQVTFQASGLLRGANITVSSMARAVRIVWDNTTGTLASYSFTGTTLDRTTISWTETHAAAPMTFNPGAGLSPTTPTFPNIGTNHTGSSNTHLGFVRRAYVDVDSVIWDFYPLRDSAGAQTSWVSATGETWTVTRATSGLLATVATSDVVVLDGVDDRIVAPAGATPSGSFTVAAVIRCHLNGTGSGRIFSSESAANNGLALYRHTNTEIRAQIGGAATSVNTGTSPTLPLSTLGLVAAVYDANAGTIAAYTSTGGLGAPVSTAGIGIVTHATPRIGARAFDAASPATMELFAAQTYNQALTEPQLDTLAAALTAGR